MSLSRLACMLIIGLLPLVALANPNREVPRWDREAYRVDRGPSSSDAPSHKRWEQMSDREREDLRRRKAHYDSLPPSEQRRLRAAREEFERMPPDRRREMRERWERMPPEEKERYRLEREIQREMMRERRN
ncbi:MAG: DUF3106 domain-containing protein [Porticoccaceae bacterium]|nr:DUF3106 domain-containing protein [Porticoccaceae bacterium]